ncbi:MAG: GNAT family N-acetyltransferase [Devosia nanyangense]|uniref:GNAT family N-acetyltransferase n=1 Tax=Devosia nanyangense TaxID=1228055 RepID=A0A933L4R3_9HYPH|nr:GNAT family N-acetyltransferase [Devosia nanyangense]
MADDPQILVVPLFSELGNLGLALRREVFIGEQHVPEDEEFDAYDLTATHLVAVDGGNVVGALRILFLDEHVKIGRVVVHRLARGRGIATRMMVFAMDIARARGETKFYLTAQIDKLALYEKLGFVAFGDEFQDGGMPHLAMKTY